MIAVLLIGFFLPLFPMSMVFNRMLGRIGDTRLRAAVMVLWPQIGLLLFYMLGGSHLNWVLPWAVLTALLYGFRLLSQREMKVWIGFLATSAWGLLWIPVVAVESLPLVWYALGFSVPLLMLLFLAQMLEERFGAAYTGLYGGLATAMPRFSGVLIFSVLAATATPLAPGFFIMLKSLMLATPLIAVILVVIWLVWSWASVLLLQGLIIGVAGEELPEDMSAGQTWLYVLALGLLVLFGIYLTGGLA